METEIEELKKSMRLINAKRVCDIGDFCHATLYNKLAPSSPYCDPTFPKPIRLSPESGKRSAVRWIEGEVWTWVELKIRQCRQSDKTEVLTCTKGERAEGQENRMRGFSKARETAP